MDPIAPAPPPLQDDMGVLALEELALTLLQDSTLLLDDETFVLELDFTELLLDDFLVAIEDDDLTTLDDDSTKEGSTELLSSPQAVKKIAAQTEAVKINLFILRIYKKIHCATHPNPSDRNT